MLDEIDHKLFDENNNRKSSRMSYKDTNELKELNENKKYHKFVKEVSKLEESKNGNIDLNLLKKKSNKKYTSNEIQPYEEKSNIKNSIDNSEENQYLLDKYNSHILGIYDIETRDKTFAYLFKKINKIPHLAYLLWYTPSLITIFVQEIIKMYPIIEQKVITKQQIIRNYNFLSLIQVLILDKKIRIKVLNCKCNKTNNNLYF
jgi:hypothetical protein